MNMNVYMTKHHVAKQEVWNGIHNAHSFPNPYMVNMKSYRNKTKSVRLEKVDRQKTIKIILKNQKIDDIEGIRWYWIVLSVIISLILLQIYLPFHFFIQLVYPGLKGTMMFSSPIIFGFLIVLLVAFKCMR